MKPDRIPDPSGSGKMVEDYWGPSKKLLADTKFLDGLIHFDKDNIPPKVRTKTVPQGLRIQCRWITVDGVLIYLAA